LSNVTYSPTHRQAGAPLINIQSTLRTSPALCKNVSLAVLLGSNGNSYTISTQPDMCICTHYSHYRDAGRAKEIKNLDSSKCRMPRNPPACHRFASPASEACALYPASQSRPVFRCVRKIAKSDY